MVLEISNVHITYTKNTKNSLNVYNFYNKIDVFFKVE